jgi:hypothetical protein
MSFKNLIIPCFSILILNACNNSKPNQQDVTDSTSSSEISTRSNHLFKEEITTYFLELKPIYMGEDSIEIDSNDFVYKSIIWPDGIDTSLIKSRTEISDPSTLKQLQILLNDTSEASMTTECYIPRHGIAWYNSKNELEAFLEICFECNGHKTWGNIKFNEAKSGGWFVRLETVLLGKTNP